MQEKLEKGILCLELSSEIYTYFIFQVNSNQEKVFGNYDRTKNIRRY